jgi:hypothetical protein
MRRGIMSLLSEYHDELGKALYAFQWIEELLRQYILRAHFAISIKVKGTLPFRPLSEKDLERESFAALLQKFKRLNSNKTLSDEIGCLRPIRNRCAHRGYLVKFKNKYDDADLRKQIDEMSRFASEADKCVRRLFNKVQHIERTMLTTK